MSETSCEATSMESWQPQKTGEGLRRSPLKSSQASKVSRQVINQIVLAMASKEALNYDPVLAAVAQIKKCSSRLKGSLALPQPNNDQDKKVSDDVDAHSREQLEGSLLTLRKHIYSFVTNPIFESPAVLDVVQAKKAGDDLESIVELSESIGKSGEKLLKLNKSTAGIKN
ncbi:MAG: hypothetical protein ACR2G5_14215 [Pyrinomonadaceae bacterium]